MKWSKEYCGVSHLGDLSDGRRATICRMGQGVNLVKLWFRGCGFSPHEVTCKSLESAKALAENWILKGE